MPVLEVDTGDLGRGPGCSAHLSARVRTRPVGTMWWFGDEAPHADLLSLLVSLLSYRPNRAAVVLAAALAASTLTGTVSLAATAPAEGRATVVDRTTDLPLADAPAPRPGPAPASRAGVRILGLESTRFVVGPASTTRLPIRVVDGSGKGLAGRRVRVFLNEYRGPDEPSHEHLLKTARTDKQGRATARVRAPFSTYDFFEYYALTVSNAKGTSVVASQQLRVKTDPALPQADPNATCSGSFPGPAAPPTAAAGFRAVFVVPCDVPGPDQTRALRVSLGSANEFFADATVDGVEPRWFRDGSGAIDVVRLQVPFTRHEFGLPSTYPKILTHLSEVMPDRAGVAPVVFMDARADDEFCGITYQDDKSPMVVIPQRECDLYPEEYDGGGGVYLTIHELTHAFGAVPDCAPHESGDGHVTDDPNDVLYQGDEEGDDLVLDAGHDDYYLTDIPGCPDIADSGFWTQPAA